MKLNDYQPYEAKMCYFTNLSIFLPYKITHNIEGDWYHIDIEDEYISLIDIVEDQQRIPPNLFHKLTASIDTAYIICSEYLLEASHIQLDLSSIYQNKSGDILFTYIPSNKQITINQSLKMFLKELDMYLPRENESVMEKIHQMYLKIS